MSYILEKQDYIHCQMVHSSITKLDLSCVVNKLTATTEQGGYAWPVDETYIVEQDYRLFLNDIFYDEKNINSNMAKKIRPTNQLVDIFWHTHILFTRKYHDDCKNIFGRYLHHEPDIINS